MNHKCAVKHKVLNAQAPEIIKFVLKFTQREADVHKPNIQLIIGASHGDDHGYLFKYGLIPTEPAGEAEKLTSRRIVEFWTNFSKYDNPTPKENNLNIERKPLEGDKINFLDIGKDLVLGVNPENERLEMWKEIFQMDPS